MAAEPAIGTRIKRARERLRWTQKQLATSVGVSQKTIDNWENGRTAPKSSIGALEEVLGVRLGDEGAGLPNPAEMERLREHIREVLGDDRAAVVEGVIDQALAKDRAKRSSDAEPEARAPRQAS